MFFGFGFAESREIMFSDEQFSCAVQAVFVEGVGVMEREIGGKDVTGRRGIDDIDVFFSFCGEAGVEIGGNFFAAEDGDIAREQSVKGFGKTGAGDWVVYVCGKHELAGMNAGVGSGAAVSCGGFAENAVKCGFHDFLHGDVIRLALPTVVGGAVVRNCYFKVSHGIIAKLKK